MLKFSLLTSEHPSTKMVNMSSLNPADRVRLNQLKRFYLDHSRLPTYEEMKLIFTLLSKNAVFKIVNRLEDGKMLRRDGSQIVPTNKFFALPVLGHIRAGDPTMEENYEERLANFNDYLLSSPETTFALEVRGDSMKDEGIKEGDLVIVEKNRSPKNGDVVAAFVDGEWTLKYWQKQDGEITLIPANDSYAPIKPKQSLEIGGVVVSVTRQYYQK